MTINLSLIPDQRYYGETTAGPARGRGPVSEGIAGGLIIAIWQPYHKGFSASHWNPGTSVAEDSRRLDGAKSLLGVQIRIPGSDRKSQAQFNLDTAVKGPNSGARHGKSDSQSRTSHGSVSTAPQLKSFTRWVKTLQLSHRPPRASFRHFPRLRSANEPSRLHQLRLLASNIIAALAENPGLHLNAGLGAHGGLNTPEAENAARTCSLQHGATQVPSTCPLPRDGPASPLFRSGQGEGLRGCG
jgi:hypothetical protein